jgi:23S rRNA (pseudouridine1915-N3)-methyltransferase
MKLVIAGVGKLKAGPERELYERYTKRLGTAGKPVGVGPLETIEISESRKGSAAERRTEEATQLAAKVPEGSLLVALDVTGKPCSSEDIASLIRQSREAGHAAIVFAIGGPDGHGSEVTEKAAKSISLGTITLPHGLARVVLAEQLYRAITILTGHPYHRS